MRLCQSMRDYLKNNPSKFHPDPIWNEGALGFFKQRWVAIWNQFLVQKTYSEILFKFSLLFFTYNVISYKSDYPFEMFALIFVVITTIITERVCHMGHTFDAERRKCIT